MNVIFSEVMIPVGQHMPLDGQTCKSVTLQELYKQSNIISLHVPKTKETEGMINKNMLNQLKKDAILINCSRGELANEPELIQHLKSTPEFKYGADVIRNEPSYGKGKVTFPFTELKNVLVTCHIGASTRQAEADIGNGVVENLQSYKKSGKFLYAVNQLKPKL